MQIATRINSDEMENSFDRQAAEYDRRAGLPAQVEPLVVRSIAEAIGAKVRPRFGNRYRAFETRLQAYATTSGDEGPEDDRALPGSAGERANPGRPRPDPNTVRSIPTFRHLGR